MHELATGIGDIGRGLGVLRAHPALWKWLIAPAIVSLILLAAAVLGILAAVGPAVGWVTGHLPGWLAPAMARILTALLVGVLVATALLVFTSVAGMIAGPFNEMLSEHVEAKLTGSPVSPFSLGEFGHGMAVSLVHGVRRLVAGLVGLAIVFAVSFVPVIGTITAVVLGAWLAGTAAAYDCYDAVFGRRAMAYRDKLAYLAHHRGRTLGLGLAVSALLLVPGLNLLALGIGAAGATVAVHAASRGATR